MTFSAAACLRIFIAFDGGGERPQSKQGQRS